MSSFQADFTFRGAAVEVRFAPGARHLVGEVMQARGLDRALVLSTSGHAGAAEGIADALGSRAAGTFTEATMHTPVAVSERAVARATEIAADCTIAIGGGSTIGLGKAIAYRTDLLQIAIPTTYAGSEATPILGQTEDGEKTTLTDGRVQPAAVLYDAELVRSLPPAMTVASALNAVAHAAEALYARDRNPVSTLLAREGMAAFASALPRVLDAPDDLAGRGETLYGAWLCGTVLGQVGMALHHKLCHTLGGSFDMPHAETHAVVLPHALGYNEAAASPALDPVCALFGGRSPGRGLWDFARRMGAPLALRDLGLAEDDLDRAADLAAARPYWNPREVTRDEIRALLGRAWRGDPPP